MNAFTPWMWEFLLLCILLFADVKGILSADDNGIPTWSDQFQVFIEGYHLNSQGMEVIEGSLYYDRPNNRAAIKYSTDEEQHFFIYRFKEKKILHTEGRECTVSDMKDSSQPLFFPYSVDDNGEMTIGPPEKVFFFNKDTAIPGEMLNDELLLRYWTSEGEPISKYNAKCNLTHYFRDSDDRTTSLVLVKINGACTLRYENEEVELNVVYRFVQFKDFIEDDEIFTPPRGVDFFNAPMKKLPSLPSYFSFELDSYSRDPTSMDVGATVALHKQVWYDVDMQLIRRDDFTEKRLIQSSYIYDFTSGVVYIMTSVSPCQMNNLTDSDSMDDVLLIDNGMFPWYMEKDRHEAVYIGQRKRHNVIFDVWSLSSKKDDGTKEVHELFYFSEIPDIPGFVSKTDMLPAFIEGYTYGDKNLETLERYVFQQFSNFHAIPRDWAAFDVSSCFKPENKIQFEMEITGRSYIKGSINEANFLEGLEMKLLEVLQISVIRLSEMKVSSTSEGFTISAIILDSPTILGYGQNTKEPSCSDAYQKLEEIVKNSKFIFNVTIFEEMSKTSTLYEAKSVKKVSKEIEETQPEGYTGGQVFGISFSAHLFGVLIGAGIVISYLRINKHNVLAMKLLGKEMQLEEVSN